MPPPSPIVVIGGGCVGLSVLRSLSLSTLLLPSPPPLFLLDASPSPGSGLTSRNSGVLHSGIYYPPSSNKERLCLRGRPLLSAFCAGRGVPLSFPGKTVVATSPGQLPYLRELLAKAEALQASGLLPPGAVTNLPDAAAVRAAEPRVSALAGARFATTGVVDVPRFVDALALACAEAPAAEIAQSAEVVGGRRDEGGWLLDVRQGSAEYQLRASLVVNAAGLGAAELYGKVVQGPRPPRHFFCQGEWLRLPGREKIFNGLVYPIPEPGLAGLGVHATVGVGEEGLKDVKFGPDVSWLPAHLSAGDLGAHYACSDGESEEGAAKIRRFRRAIESYFPGVADLALVPDQVGIRPKLWHPDALPGGDADFVIRRERGAGDGWINLLGIESPGLTSCMAIGEEVAALAQDFIER